VEMLLEAAALEPRTRVVVTGDGVERRRLEEAARRDGLDGRVVFTGRVDAAALAELYARCLAVYYAPVDEDFGMVPYEAFLSGKGVLTTTDAGGPLEVVQDGRTGAVVAPRAEEIAAAWERLTGDTAAARAWGEAGRVIAERVTWDDSITRLLA